MSWKEIKEYAEGVKHLRQLRKQVKNLEEFRLGTLHDLYQDTADYKDLNVIRLRYTDTIRNLFNDGSRNRMVSLMNIPESVRDGWKQSGLSITYLEANAHEMSKYCKMKWTNAKLEAEGAASAHILYIDNCLFVAYFYPDDEIYAPEEGYWELWPFKHDELIHIDIDQVSTNFTREYAAKKIQGAVREWFWKPRYRSGRVGLYPRKEMEPCNVRDYLFAEKASHVGRKRD